MRSQLQIEPAGTGPNFLLGQLSALRELWHRRDLVIGLAARDLRVKYKGSALGFVWALINPLLTVAVLAGVFTFVVRIQVENFWAFLISGYFVWRFVVQTLNSATFVLSSHGPLSRAAAFPQAAPIVAAALSRLVEFSIELLMVLVVLTILFHRGVPSSFVVLPWLIIVQVLMGLGIAFPIATLSAFYRDVQHAVPVLLTALFYMTPVFYPLSLVPDRARLLFLANPLAWLLEPYHVVVYGGQFPTWGAILAATGIAGVLFVVGYGLFNRYALIFAEVV